ncbi:hypothetical protein E2C01_000393 [Portunus trituberculatus]|uniref:Uncharacterized protein n=1 Tax=Portunus trituberculatus TaxID=210409 RepID=A0A5B7CH47_PORTR|nr:hypothetical protein [Portunus trituberculatus]
MKVRLERSESVSPFPWQLSSLCDTVNTIIAPEQVSTASTFPLLLAITPFPFPSSILHPSHLFRGAPCLTPSPLPPPSTSITSLLIFTTSLIT